MSQNSMKQMSKSEWKIDSRGAADIEDRIEELAASYVPEWHFDRERPDIGSVIGKFFAAQMEGNIGRYNQVLARYHTEFVNLLGISLLPARPAGATVLLDLVQDTIPGVEVYKGTKFLADAADGEDQIVFEAAHNVYITSASLDYLFMTLKQDGSILPLKGNFASPEFVETEEEPAQTGALLSEGVPGKMKSFRLFGKTADQNSIGKNALLFYHETALDVENNPIFLKITGNQKLLKKMQEGAYRFRYYTASGLVPVESVKVLPETETVVLKKEKKNAGVEIDERTVSLLVIEALKPVLENDTVSGILVSSEGRPVPVQFANDGSTDFDVASFDLFGDTLSLFQECYIGHQDYFGKAGAVIRLTFDVSWREHRILDRIPGEDNSLKIIKRKPKVIWVDSAADARAEEISFEYFNGIGWKKLVCMQEIRNLFHGDEGGRYEISFVCPGDWREAEAGAWRGRCVRIRLLKSDNCYMRPCIHHYPHVEHLEVSFSYEGRYMAPQYLRAIAGTRWLDLTKKAREGECFTAFSKGVYTEDALYLGFPKKFESGPVSLLFQIEDGIRYEGIKCRFAYSTRKGFKQMKVLDHTADLSRSGTVMFMPQADMHAFTLEGKRAYWIRISRVSGKQEKSGDVLPVIKNICLNAVQVLNVESREEEDYYLEELRPDMTIPLGVTDILDIELWVNEKDRHTRAQMQKLLEEEKENVRAEYDILGNITAFYVKWQETDQIEDAPSKRCYMLDRMNSLLIFGDGVRTALPTVLDGVAFKVQIRCCNGERGNVGPGQIRESMGNLMFVDQIYNPVKAHGGSSIESVDKALKRGANILKSRRRLVAADDYVQEILGFSDAIDKVRCVAGRTIDGGCRENALTFVILLKDFEAGSYSFHNVSELLKKHLQESCELTIAMEDLSVVEPIFARVCVDIWAEVLKMDDGFEIQSLLKETLKDYLDPIRGQQGGGWEIGILPRRSQILMKLNVLKSRAVIRKIVITVQYTDRMGTHEVDLDDMQENPYMICCSGNHQVNIALSGR